MRDDRGGEVAGEVVGDETIIGAAVTWRPAGLEEAGTVGTLGRVKLIGVLGVTRTR